MSQPLVLHMLTLRLLFMRCCRELEHVKSVQQAFGRSLASRTLARGTTPAASTLSGGVSAPSVDEREHKLKHKAMQLSSVQQR